MGIHVADSQVTLQLWEHFPLICLSQPSAWFAHRMDPVLLPLSIVWLVISEGLLSPPSGFAKPPLQTSGTHLAGGAHLGGAHTLLAAISGHPGTSEGSWVAVNIPSEHPSSKRPKQILFICFSCQQSVQGWDLSHGVKILFYKMAWRCQDWHLSRAPENNYPAPAVEDWVCCARSSMILK